MAGRTRPSGTVAILIFADAQQRDLRRRGLPSSAASLLALPRLDGLSCPVDLHWFTDRPTAPPKAGIHVHAQRGRTFGQRLENAVEELAGAGYERVIILGRDCPQLTTSDVDAAVAMLDSRRLVIGPDHRGGCWLIGLHMADRSLLHGVRWERDTDADELRRRFGEQHSAILETKFDLDGIDDLHRLARFFLPAALIVQRFVHDVATHFSRSVARQRIALQLPPPRLAPQLCA